MLNKNVKVGDLMWHDVETTDDLVNFSVVANTAAQLILDTAETPISIGISGSWGTGKSSLVKMIAAALHDADATTDKYVFMEFNAWLYQGYEDARMALLHSVSDVLISEANRRKTLQDKALEFAKRVNWLSVSKLIASAVSSAMIGGALGGPLGAAIGATGTIIKGDGSPTPENIEAVKNAYSALHPQLKELLREKEAKSLPKEINELREAFGELLRELDITLVVLVDDLDRCLPTTAISTLEAMRLLLFLPRTAFVIAADEEMIRSAVRTHFSTGLSDDLVTSYFDKLIQVPLRVPRLGVTEVKSYLILLLAELAVRKGSISQQRLDSAKETILATVRKPWESGLSKSTLRKAFGEDADKIAREIDLADQLAGLMVSADRIAGNPRLIKRFLNNLIIRDNVAKAQGLTVGFEHLVKMQLFERCASPAAFEYLAKHIANSGDGKAHFLADIEDVLSAGGTPTMPDPCWDTSFIKEWLKLYPKLGDTDLRPLLHFSSDRTMSLASFDELSSEGRELLEALYEARNIHPTLVDQLKILGEAECERILSRIIRNARLNQWETNTLVQALHITKAFPNLGSRFVSYLGEIPPARRSAPFIPHIRDESWAQEMLDNWATDSQTPLNVKNAINQIERRP